MLQVMQCLSLKMCLIILGLLDCVKCADRTTHNQLLSELLMNYDNPYSRPVINDSRAVSVGFRFAPVMTVLDETTQELQVRGMFLLTWRDDRLMWNETDYDGILETTVPLFEDGVGKPVIWKPELVLYQSLGITLESVNPDTKSVTVNHTGYVYWYTLATTKSSCTVLVRYYPFDKQICELTFTTWLYQTNEQIFYVVRDILDNGAYKSYEICNAQWSVVVDTVQVGNATYECITCEGQEQSFVYYRFILTRGQHWLYFFNIILPCFVMSVMTLIVIWLPEKDVAGAASLGVTCILAFFVFLTFLFTQLPATGIPLIGGYIVWLIGEATVVTIYAVYRATKKQKESNNDTDSNHEGQVIPPKTVAGDEANSSSFRVSMFPIDCTDTDQDDQFCTQPQPKTRAMMDSEEEISENRNSSGCDNTNVNDNKGPQQVNQLPEDGKGSGRHVQPQNEIQDESINGNNGSGEDCDPEVGPPLDEPLTTEENNPKAPGDFSSQGDAHGANQNPTNAKDNGDQNGKISCCFPKRSTLSKTADTQSDKNTENSHQTFLNRVQKSFNDSNYLTKVMIFIKALTTLVFIIILFTYIGA